MRTKAPYGSAHGQRPIISRLKQQPQLMYSKRETQKSNQKHQKRRDYKDLSPRLTSSTRSCKNKPNRSPFKDKTHYNNIVHQTNHQAQQNHYYPNYLQKKVSVSKENKENVSPHQPQEDITPLISNRTKQSIGATVKKSLLVLQDPIETVNITGSSKKAITGNRQQSYEEYLNDESLSLKNTNNIRDSFKRNRDNNLRHEKQITTIKDNVKKRHNNVLYHNRIPDDLSLMDDSHRNSTKIPFDSKKNMSIPSPLSHCVDGINNKNSSSDVSSSMKDDNGIFTKQIEKDIAIVSEKREKEEHDANLLNIEKKVFGIIESIFNRQRDVQENHQQYNVNRNTITKDMIDVMRHSNPDDKNIISAMLTSEKEINKNGSKYEGINKLSILGKTVGGNMLHRSDSLDGSDITMYTNFTQNNYDEQALRDIVNFHNNDIKQTTEYSELSGVTNQELEKHRFTSSKVINCQNKRQKSRTRSFHGERLSINSKQSAMSHPPLPPGWVIKISRSKKLPYYRHPDFGSTWHCPVVLPEEFSLFEKERDGDPDILSDKLHSHNVSNDEPSIEIEQNQKDISDCSQISTVVEAPSSPISELLNEYENSSCSVDEDFIHISNDNIPSKVPKGSNNEIDQVLEYDDSNNGSFLPGDSDYTELLDATNKYYTTKEMHSYKLGCNKRPELNREDSGVTEESVCSAESIDVSTCTQKIRKIDPHDSLKGSDVSKQIVNIDTKSGVDLDSSMTPEKCAEDCHSNFHFEVNENRKLTTVHQSQVQKIDLDDEADFDQYIHDDDVVEEAQSNNECVSGERIEYKKDDDRSECYSPGVDDLRIHDDLSIEEEALVSPKSIHDNDDKSSFSSEDSVEEDCENSNEDTKFRMPSRALSRLAPTCSLQSLSTKIRI